MRIHGVWNDKLEDRLDVEYYQPEYYQLLNQLTSKNKVVKLAELGHIFDGPFGSNLKNEEYEDNGIPLLRVQNVKDGKLYLENNSAVFISEEKHDELKRSEVLPGDVVITKTGWLGNSAVIPTSVPKANIRADLAGVRLTNKQILPEFLALFIDSNIGKKLMARLNSGSTRGRVVVSNIKTLQIPLLTIDKQKEIIAKAQDVFIENSKNKLQAHKLLISIDNYILDKLGISIDKTDDSTTFTVWSDVIEGRFDSSYYKPIYTKLIEQLDVKSNVIRFDNIIEELSGGATPIVTGDYYSDKAGIPFLRVQNITEDGISLEDIKYIKREVHEGMLRRSQLQANDLVFTITGRIGSVAVCPNVFVGNINQHSIRIKLKNKIEAIEVNHYNEVHRIFTINPYYIAIYFNSSVGRMVSLRDVTGGTRPALDYKALRSLRIVLPSDEIQNEIVKEVNKRKRDARALLDEINTSLEEAKNKIEQMILGG
jgi:restriction endonuclease S subunit